MANDRTPLEAAVTFRMVRLNAIVQGVVVGLFAGAGIFVATNWLLVKGGDVVGPHMALLGQFLIGYEVSFVGSLIGFAYGFSGGFTAGYVFSLVYNFIVDMRAGARSGTQQDG